MENLRKLLKSEKNVWVRIPIIPKINDTKEEMLKIRDYLYSCGKPQKIELLPYHAFGEHKYPAIGKEQGADPFLDFHGKSSALQNDRKNLESLEKSMLSRFLVNDSERYPNALL